ncbi:MAG: hypothetical protein COC19_05515 [SAR86 cluster bacterium]|uniref:HEAT repeat domain-containing protein n=1 Tax=SAR86 cluster bacterium TaxID=2030880 RepID=A0A2A4MLE2_9GAMM|nr:MAG: hypothetical protein COC19_05515 [SAR86 cluster bacterium]
MRYLKRNLWQSSLPAFLFLLLCTTLSAAQHETSEPAFEDVLKLVRTYFDSDSDDAQLKIETWGNSALDHLWDIANLPNNYSVELALVSIIEKIETPESIDMLLSIAAGNSSIEPTQVLSSFHMEILYYNKNDYLRTHPKFKEVVFNFTTHPDWPIKSQAVEIIAAMSWDDGIALIEPFLRSDIISLRLDTAKAIQTLTGKRPDFEMLKAQFPAVALQEQLISATLPLPNDARFQILWLSFFNLKFPIPMPSMPPAIKSIKATPWFDGSSVIVKTLYPFGFSSNAEEMQIYDTSLNRHSAYQPSVLVYDFIITPSSQGSSTLDSPQRQMVALVSDKDGFMAEYVAALDEQGQVLWENQPERLRVESLSPIYDDNGEINFIVVAYFDSLKILNLAGEEIFQFKNQYSVNELHSHASIPWTFISVGDSIKTFSFRDGRARLHKESSTPNYFFRARQSKMYTNTEGKLQILAHGSGEDTLPKLISFNENLEVQWQASVPFEIQDIAMLEIASMPNSPIFMTITEDSTYYIFDSHGTLLVEDKVSASYENMDTYHGSLEGITVNDEYGYFSEGNILKNTLYRIGAKP